MCARFELNKTRFQPGRPAGIWRTDGRAEQVVWAGFARSESLSFWQHKGGELVDVPAHRFAERSKMDGRLIWDDVPAGLVIRGLVDPSGKTPLLKIVTREPTVEEIARFEHPRMPLLEPPVHSAAAPPFEPPAASLEQTELF